MQKRPVALKLVGQVSETKQRYMFNIHNQSAHEMIEDYIAALRTIAGSGGGGTCKPCKCLGVCLIRERLVTGIKDAGTRK